MEPSLLHRLRSRGTDAGFNLVGAVDAADYDRSQPECRRVRSLRSTAGTVVVFGSGGRGLWEAVWNGESGGASPASGCHPIESYTRSFVATLENDLAAQGIESTAVYPEDRRTLAFAPLAEMAGIGTVSPVIGLLLHPEYGPWISLRAALLMDGRPLGAFEKKREPFVPCLNCTRPCVQACPQQVYDGFGGMDAQRCGEYRHAGHCADGCAVRRLCPVGTEHRYGAEEERFRHAYSLFSMRKHFGLGWWRLVPERLRRS